MSTQRQDQHWNAGAKYIQQLNPGGHDQRQIIKPQPTSLKVTPTQTKPSSPNQLRWNPSCMWLSEITWNCMGFPVWKSHEIVLFLSNIYCSIHIWKTCGAKVFTVYIWNNMGRLFFYLSLKKTCVSTVRFMLIQRLNVSYLCWILIYMFAVLVLWWVRFHADPITCLSEPGRGLWPLKTGLSPQ